MTKRIPAWLVWSLCLLVAALVVFMEGLYLSAWDATNPERFTGALWLTLALPFAVVAALISARRPGNRIGVLLLWGTVAFAGFQAALSYVMYGLPQSLPGLAFAGWIANWIWVPAAIGFLLLPLLYPDGQPLSPRWRPLIWVAMTYGSVMLVVMAVSPDLIADQSLANPFGLRGTAAEALRQLVDSGVGDVIAVPILFASAGSLLLRFRRSRGVERQQLKWFAYAVALLLATWVVGVLLISELTGILLLLSVWTIPLAIGVAILRYRLYDIDRIINRTVVYGLLTALLGGIYGGLVLVLGQLFGDLGGRPSSWVVAGATLTVAALFQPARRRIQAVVDRRFDRRRYDMAKTVEAFSGRLRNHVDLDTLSAELLMVVDQTVQPAKASLWLRPATQVRPRGQGQAS